MKVIVSHDVDHLHWNDHLTDLFYPKLWVRETLAVLCKQISAKEWCDRMCIPFHRNLHHLDEVMRFDKENEIPSTFFFGMASGLGMSYSRKKALAAIRMVQLRGFETGVHGCAYQDPDEMTAEYQAFIELTGRKPDGIRMHYVRYDDATFKKLADIGYPFDSTEFDKRTGTCVKDAYTVGRMAEFPVCMMDTYLPYDFDKAKALTLDALDKAEREGLRYFTVLFHDPHFSREYSVYKQWYEWLINYFIKNDYQFTSFKTALPEVFI